VSFISDKVNNAISGVKGKMDNYILYQSIYNHHFPFVFY